MSAGVIAASFADSLIEPIANAFYIPDHSHFVAWPEGTVAGDLVVLQTEYGWTGLPPSNWAVHYNVSGANGSGALYSKIMTSGDITAGGVTLTATGNYDYPGSGNIVRIPGTGGGETLTNTNQTGVLNIGDSPSNVEQVVDYCDLDLSSPSNIAVIDWNFWWSMSEGGGGKVVTWRVRKDNLSGTILASGSQGASVDSTGGHDRNHIGQVVDPSVTTGRYVLTVQCTGGFTSPIYSDSRVFTVRGGIPAVRTFSGGYSATGFTSLGLSSPAALAANEKILWLVSARVNGVMGLNRATLLGRQNNSEGSSGAWRETTSGAGTVSGTFTCTVSGSNEIIQAVMVSMP